MAGAELQVDCYECVVSMSVVAKQKISNITSELSYSINNYYSSIDNGSVVFSLQLHEIDNFNFELLYWHFNTDCFISGPDISETT